MNETARAAQAAAKYCQNAACGAAKATLRCTGCDNAWYDSRECQKARWRAGHKAEYNDMAEDVLLPGGLGCEPVKRFKKGTRLVMRDRSGHVPPRDLYATVVQFVPGKGPYADASVKYDSRRYRGYGEDALCHYALKYDHEPSGGELFAKMCMTTRENNFVVLPGVEGKSGSRS
jgi:MYND finger